MFVLFCGDYATGTKVIQQSNVLYSWRESLIYSKHANSYQLFDSHFKASLHDALLCIMGEMESID